MTGSILLNEMLLSIFFSSRCTTSKDDRDVCHRSHRGRQYRPAGGNYPKYPVSMKPENKKLFKCVEVVSLCDSNGMKLNMEKVCFM